MKGSKNGDEPGSIVTEQDNKQLERSRIQNRDSRLDSAGPSRNRTDQTS